MDIENMKNIVVLKNLPSNMIEQAIVILKDNVKIQREEKAICKNKNKKDDLLSKKNDKEYIVKEAEMLIEEYVNNVKNEKVSYFKSRNYEGKYKRLKYFTILLFGFSILSVASFFLR